MYAGFQRRIVGLDELAGLTALFGIARTRNAAIGAEIARRGGSDSRSQYRGRGIAAIYHPRVPTPPLNGPTMREVIQPP